MAIHYETRNSRRTRRPPRRPRHRAVTPPIHLSTTFERGADGGYPLGFSYSRDGNPNRQALEECLAAVKGGKEALVFSSGMAVAAALIVGLEPGDHIIASDDVYYCLKQLIAEVFGKWLLETQYVDMTDPQNVRDAVRPNPRLIFVETPFESAAENHRSGRGRGHRAQANAITVADDTFATPVLQRPFEHSIDVVMHSTTKYMGGHSDLVGGALITRHDNYLFERARKVQKYGGATPAPFDCWLALRGLDTLPYRVRAHSANALRVAQFLRAHPAVEAVHYPGLPDHPGHALAARQMCGGFGGMLSFQVHGDREEAMASPAVRLVLRWPILDLLEH